MSDQNNILPPEPGKHPGGTLLEEKLMAYLEGKLSATEQHEVEEWIGEESMEGDALEGLKTVSATETKNSVARLNHNLNKKLLKKKRKRRSPDTAQITWIAILLILILIILAYVLITKSIH